MPDPRGRSSRFPPEATVRAGSTDAAPAVTRGETLAANTYYFTYIWRAVPGDADLGQAKLCAARLPGPDGEVLDHDAVLVGPAAAPAGTPPDRGPPAPPRRLPGGPGVAVELTTEHIVDDGTAFTIRLGEPPMSVPEPVASLIRDYRNTDHHRLPHVSARSRRWLFPGRQAGQPMTPRALQTILGDVGITPGAGRAGALCRFVEHTPPPVAAKALGYTDVTRSARRRARTGCWIMAARGDRRPAEERGGDGRQRAGARRAGAARLDRTDLRLP